MELKEKSYKVGPNTTVENCVKTFVTANKLTKLEAVPGGDVWFAAMGDVDFKITTVQSNGKIVVKASENTRQLVEKATETAKVLSVEDTTALSQAIERANEQYLAGQSNVLELARLVKHIQDKKAWQSYGKGFTNWKDFCDTYFKFHQEYVAIAIRVIKHPEVGPIAESLGIGKAYTLCRAGDKLTKNDIEYAKPGTVSNTDLKTHLGDKLKGRARGSQEFKASKLDELIKDSDEKGLIAIRSALTKRIDTINSRLAGIAERREAAKKPAASTPSIDQDQYKRFLAFQEYEKAQAK